MEKVRFKHVESRFGLRRWLFTTVKDSIRMGRVRRAGTALEIAVRQVASDLGLRYRLDNGDLQGSPDLANRTNRWAVFVHGCFWHAHVGCSMSSIPKRNRTFWRAKLRANRARDARAIQALRDNGYRVEVIWGCQAIKESLILKTLRTLSRPRRNVAQTTPRSPLRRARRPTIVRIRRPKKMPANFSKHRRRDRHR